MATFSGNLSLQVLIEHPRLVLEGYTVTSPETIQYNCIAWAANDNSLWWWPDQMNNCFWPAGVPREETISAFKMAYATAGYAECTDGQLKVDVEKIALYVNSQNTPTHAARQLADGSWTSKLGRCHDISHTLEGLTDNVYGGVALFMQRARVTS